MRFFRDLLDRASEIDVHHTDTVFLDQPASHFGHCLRVVVPDLDGQGARFLPHAPEPVRVFAIVFVEPNKTPSVDHLRGLKSGAAELANDLPECKVGVASHRSLQNRRIDLHGADLDWERDAPQRLL